MNKPDFTKGAADNNYRVVIFGSAQVKKENPVYKDIYNLGSKIAGAGFDVVTGGGPGVMEAASKGHQAGRKDKKVCAIGVNIRLPFEQKPNKELDVVEEHDRFSSRLDEFMQLANIFVFAPGGIGTSLEFFYTWQLIQVKHTCFVPLIMIGPEWKALIEWVKKSPMPKGYLKESDLQYVINVDNGEEAFKVIEDAHAHFKKSGEKACLNWKKYKIT